MLFRGSVLRSGAGMVLVAAALGAGAMSETAAATTPPVAWANLSAIRILCLVDPAVAAGRRELEAQLCARVAALASEGAPAPVSVVGFGDPAIIDPTVATLLVHAAIEGDGEGETRRLLFAIRPFRAGGVQNVVLFGAAPRSVPIGPDGPEGGALDSALVAALSETLPWKAN